MIETHYDIKNKDANLMPHNDTNDNSQALSYLWLGHTHGNPQLSKGEGMWSGKAVQQWAGPQGSAEGTYVST